jgi:hypothetical protein
MPFREVRKHQIGVNLSRKSAQKLAREKTLLERPFMQDAW